jgi:hypothetical protein
VLGRTRYLSAGLSLARNFPMGQQQDFSVTVDGKPGAVADYLPSVHVRFNSGNWDLQTEVRIITPQYTHPSVVDSTGGDSSRIFPYQGFRQYNVCTVKKLYYSELAVLLDRQFFNGLWVGAGFGFGHLQGAFGTQDILMKATNPGTRDTVYRSEAINLKKNDTAYGRLSGSDWRLLLNVEYRWRRWSAGFRYERSLNPFLPVQANGSGGKDRNETFSVHLGYELWQGRK